MKIYHRFITAEYLDQHIDLTYRSREAIETFVLDEDAQLLEAGYDYAEIDDMTQIEKYMKILDDKNIDYSHIDENFVYFNGWFAFTEDSSDDATFDPMFCDFEIVFEGTECNYPSVSCEKIVNATKILSIKQL